MKWIFLTCASASFFSTEAFAQVAPDYPVQVIGKKHNECMRGSKSIEVGDGFDAYHQGCKAEEKSQYWTFELSTTSPGYYIIKNQETGTCLVFSTKYTVKNDDGKEKQNVYHKTCKDDDSQLFEVKAASDGTWSIKNKKTETCAIFSSKYKTPSGKSEEVYHTTCASEESDNYKYQRVLFVK